MHGDRLLDDESISNKLADGLAGVGIGDFAGFVGIEPDLALSTAYNRSCKPLLRSEVAFKGD